MHGLSSEMILVTAVCLLIVIRLWRMFLAAALFLVLLAMTLGILSFVSWISHYA
jgi:hypothetical protein